MSKEFVGVTINVNHGGRKGLVKEAVVTQLKNGTLRTKEGSEFNVADLYNKGKGKFVDLKGGVTKKPAAAKAAAAPAPAARNERPAPAAVTAAELREKARRINGIEIESVLPKAGVVKLVDGSKIAIADIQRKGKGYVSEVVETEPKAKTKAPAAKAAPAAKTTPAKKTVGGVTKKVKASDDNQGPKFDGALFGPAGQYETKDVRGKVIDFNGEDAKVKSTFNSGRCVLEDGTEFQIDEVRMTNSGKFCVYSDDYINELKELWEQANVRKAPAKAEKEDDAPVTTRDLKKNTSQVVVGKRSQVVARVFTNGTIELDSGLRIHVSDISRSGAKFVYGGAQVQKSGGALPKTREVPPSQKKIIRVSEFDTDTAGDIRDMLEEKIREWVATEYDINLVSGFAGAGSDICTFAFSFAVADADPKHVKAIVDRQRAENFADDTETDLDHHQLTQLDDDRPEDEEEEEEEPEEEEELEEEELEEEEETEEDEDFPQEEIFEVAESSFPDDISKLLEDATDRMKRVVKNPKFQGAMLKTATAWYKSQDAYTAFSYGIEPGSTVELKDQTYLFIGLRPDGAIALINVASEMLKTLSFDEFTQVCEDNDIEL